MVETSVEVIVREPAPVETATVGTAVEIDRGGARTVFDAVDQLVPGAFVTRRGIMGYGIATNGTGSVSIRGIGGSPNTGVLIVVDGRPDMQGLMGHPLPDFYSLSNAESVSVTEGPASVLYGSNAMGGAIEIVPSRPFGRDAYAPIEFPRLLLDRAAPAGTRNPVGEDLLHASRRDRSHSR